MIIKVISTYYTAYNGISYEIEELGRLIGKNYQAESYTSYCTYTGYPTEMYIIDTGDGRKINAHPRDCEIILHNIEESSPPLIKKCCNNPRLTKTTYKLFGQIQQKDIYYYCQSCKQETDKNGFCCVIK